jgi:hypothetical protein
MRSSRVKHELREMWGVHGPRPGRVNPSDGRIACRRSKHRRPYCTKPIRQSSRNGE